MTEGEKKAKYEHIVATATDPAVVARALDVLQSRWPDEWGQREASHELPLTPAQREKIVREQKAGTEDFGAGSNVSIGGHLDPPTFRNKMQAALGVGPDIAANVSANPGSDAFRGLRNMVNGATVGISGAVTDRLGIDSKAARDGEHPGLARFENMVGGLESALATGAPVNMIGRGAAGLVGMAESAVPALARTAVGRVAGHAATGALAGAGVSGAEAAFGGGNLRDVVKSAGLGALIGGPLGALAPAFGAAGRWVGNKIYGADPALRELEKAGFTPTPVPGRPTRSSTGVPGAPASPSEALGLPASPGARGQLGREAADTIQNEVGFLRRQEGHRAGTELEAAINKPEASPAAQPSEGEAGPVVRRGGGARRPVPAGGGPAPEAPPTPTQGKRLMGLEEEIKYIDGELANPTMPMNPRMRTALTNARKMLTGQMEPTADLYAEPSGAHVQPETRQVGGATVPMSPEAAAAAERPIVIHSTDPYPYRNRPGVDNVEINEPDPNYGVHSRVPYDPRPEPGRPAAFEGKHSIMYSGGKLMEQPPTGPEQEIYTPLNKRIQSIGPDVTAHAGGEEPIVISQVEERMLSGGKRVPAESRPAFETRTASADPQKTTIGVGDVRGRVGPDPNHVRDAATVNQVRDALDTAIGTEVFQTRGPSGDTKPVLPLLRLANMLRQRIRSEAPAIGLANRRSHAARTKLERTEARLKGQLDDSEAPSAQIANAGDPESTGAGGREARLGPPENIPQSRRGGELRGLGRGDLNLRAQFPEGRLRGPEINRILDAPRLLRAEEAQHYDLSLRPHRNLSSITNRLLYPVARGAAVATGSEASPGLSSILAAPPPASTAGARMPVLAPELSKIFSDPRLLQQALRMGPEFMSLFQPVPMAGDRKAQQ